MAKFAPAALEKSKPYLVLSSNVRNGRISAGSAIAPNSSHSSRGLMSPMGHERRSSGAIGMTAFPPKADMVGVNAGVRDAPILLKKAVVEVAEFR